MTEFVGYIQTVLGSPPAGAEFFEYIFAGCLLLIVCVSAISMVSGLFRWIGGL